MTGNYGTFEIERIVEAESEEEAFEQTGIMLDLVALGWTVVWPPTGEVWAIQEVTE